MSPLEVWKYRTCRNHPRVGQNSRLVLGRELPSHKHVPRYSERGTSYAVKMGGRVATFVQKTRGTCMLSKRLGTESLSWGSLLMLCQRSCPTRQPDILLLMGLGVHFGGLLEHVTQPCALQAPHGSPLGQRDSRTIVYETKAGSWIALEALTLTRHTCTWTMANQ